MQPLGRKPIRFPSKRDNHIREDHHPLGNWWEDHSDCGKAEKKAERMSTKLKLKIHLK